MNTDPRFKAATENDEERECRRHRPMNAEGCKPETDILLSSAPCAGAKLCRSLDKAEGCKSDIKSSIRPPMASHSLDLPAICDICGKGRSTRRHTKCSQIRQQRESEKWESYMANVAAKKSQQPQRPRPLR